MRIRRKFSFDEGSHETRWELNVFDKRKIVLDHLFGVDLDEQAVEVTRLSLMLKMLEGEHGIIPGRAVLPTLDHNIQCGNSLISGDVLKLQSFFKEDWIKTKPFDWSSVFSKDCCGRRRIRCDHWKSSLCPHSDPSQGPGGLL